MMKAEEIVAELVLAAAKLGLEVRTETGRFRGGRCTIDDVELILLNKRQPPETHLAILAESLREVPIDTVFLPPAVRTALEQSWVGDDQIDVELADGD